MRSPSPEIQRPFVWDAVKVRDLLDSLFSGYPVGYVISWRNPDVALPPQLASVFSSLMRLDEPTLRQRVLRSMHG